MTETFVTDITLGTGKLTEMAGSEGDIVISHGVSIHPEFRNRGYGQRFHKDRIKTARELNKSYMLAVVNATNLPEIRIMEKFGWKHLDSFISECSCHRIHIYGRSTFSEKGMD